MTSPSSEAVFNALKEDIIFGRLHPRERLVERDLSERFDVKRGVVRSALAQLTDIGLVEHAPNRGASVIDLSLDEIEEIYRIRIELETLVAEWMPLPLGDDACAELEAIQNVHEQAIAKKDLQEIFDLNARFHHALNSHCGNRYLEMLIKDMMHRALSVRLSAYMEDEHLSEVVSDHWAIISHLRNGDRDALVKIMREHHQRGLIWYKRQREKSAPLTRAQAAAGQLS